MPHSTLPYVGFQAVILCGPGASFDTFTSNPKDFPKALLPIANRPMIWYPLDWCYRMGVTDITLVAPPESAEAIRAALDQNPFLTGLPAPKPELLAPSGLTQTTGTGEIFKLPEVIKAITTDFVVLPCDLVSELDGTALVQTWMTLQASLGGTGTSSDQGFASQVATSGEKIGRRGGLGVWYPTKGVEGITTKAEQTDFIATVPSTPSNPPPPNGSLQPQVKQLVMSMPKSTVKDIVEDKGALQIRHTLLKRYGHVDIKTTYRDAHIYFFPHWALRMMEVNEFDSVAEDVIGWWAKAGWQPGLGDKLGLRSILQPNESEQGRDDLATSQVFEEEVDLVAMSTTLVSTARNSQQQSTASSRVPAALASALHRKALTIPPLLAYVQSPHSVVKDQGLIRRVDTSSLLLSMSLRLAKLPSITECAEQQTPSSPFAHKDKVAHPDMIQRQSRVFEPDSLLAANVSVEPRVNIKESVVGANCTIGSGSRITKCVLMDNVVIGENVTLQGCIVGRRSRIEGGPGKDEGTRLVDCEVQNGFVVEKGSESFPLRVASEGGSADKCAAEAKNEKFMAFEGLDQDDDDGDDDDEMDLDAADDLEDDTEL